MMLSAAAPLPLPEHLNTGDRKIVSEQEFAAVVADFFRKGEEELDEDDAFVLIETPPEDMARIEQLLDTKFSTPYAVKTKRELCPDCGRRNTFLDVVESALKVHAPAFLRDVFHGRYGFVVNCAPAQRCFCSGCKKQLPADANKFSAPVPPTEAQRQMSAYYYPVYSYKC